MSAGGLDTPGTGVTSSYEVSDVDAGNQTQIHCITVLILYSLFLVDSSDFYFMQIIYILRKPKR